MTGEGGEGEREKKARSQSKSIATHQYSAKNLRTLGSTAIKVFVDAFLVNACDIERRPFTPFVGPFFEKYSATKMTRLEAACGQRTVLFPRVLFVYGT